MSEINQPKTRSARLQSITDIIGQNRIRSQRELAQLLADSGFDVAQPTLSRDLFDLGVAKDSAGYYIIDSDAITNYSRLEKSLRELLVYIETSDQFCVLRTPPGGAHLLAGAIDRSKIDGVLGTIAGDDTVLMITRDKKVANDIFSKFMQSLEAKLKE